MRFPEDVINHINAVQRHIFLHRERGAVVEDRYILRCFEGHDRNVMLPTCRTTGMDFAEVAIGAQTTGMNIVWLPSTHTTEEVNARFVQNGYTVDHLLTVWIITPESFASVPRPRKSKGFYFEPVRSRRMALDFCEVVEAAVRDKYPYSERDFDGARLFCYPEQLGWEGHPAAPAQGVVLYDGGLPGSVPGRVGRAVRTVCMHAFGDGLASFSFGATRPEYQRCGVGDNMLWHLIGRGAFNNGCEAVIGVTMPAARSIPPRFGGQPIMMYQVWQKEVKE